MAKYRKTALVEAQPYEKGLEDGFVFISIEEVQYCDNDGQYNFYRDVCSNEYSVRDDSGFPTGWNVPYCKTEENQKLFISDGDYIITNVTGERYPCKPDIFEQTYELVE